MNAIEFFSKALDEKVVPREQEPEIVYLVGEIYRRVGQSEKSSEWLGRAEGMARATEGLEGLADLARQQRTEPQEIIP